MITAGKCSWQHFPKFNNSASDKGKLFAENISKNSNLDDSGISLPVFPLSRTNLKLHNISVNPKMVKKVIMNQVWIQCSKEVSQTDYILVFNLAGVRISRYTSIVTCVVLSTLVCFLGAHQCKVSWKLHLNTLNTDLQSMMQTIDKFAAC